VFRLRAKVATERGIYDQPPPEMAVAAEAAGVVTVTTAVVVVDEFVAVTGVGGVATAVALNPPHVICWLSRLSSPRCAQDVLKALKRLKRQP